MDDGFRSLSVISRAPTRNERKQCSNKRRTLSSQNVCLIAVRTMPQQLNSRDDTVLAKRKAAHTMIAGRTQPARALIALNHRRILSMVAAAHHYFAKASVIDFD